MKGIFRKLPFVAWKTRSVLVALLLFEFVSSSAEPPKSHSEKLGTLKMGDEVYSNVTVTAVTVTDIYFTYSGGMGNAKLEQLDPELQKKFHFDPKKVSQQEDAEKKGNAAYLSWIRRQTNKAPVSPELDPYISVQVADAVIQYQYYNPIVDRPRHLSDGGLARIDSSFNIKTEVEVHAVSGSGKPSRFQIDSAKISIELPIMITMPATPTERLKNHLEGHREIYEHFYELAPKAAEQAARSARRRAFTPPNTPDGDSRKARFQSAVQRAVELEYWKYTKYPAEAASRYYDELTEFGRNRVDSDEAAREAIQRCEVKIPDGSTVSALSQ